MAKMCVLYDRVCSGCGECDYCDINPLKLCDNCGKCIDSGKEYQEIKIDAVITSERRVDKWHKHDHNCGCGHC